MSYKYDRLQVTECAPGILHCKLHRPKKLNAFDPQMWSDIRSFFAAVESDSAVRCILLSGSGRAFTSGLDLMSASTGGPLASGDEEDAARRGFKIRSTGKQWQESFTNIELCGKPVVACVHNACIGAGIEMLSACDVRFCSADAFFAMAEVDVALAADVGGLQRFPKIVGNDSLVRSSGWEGRYNCIIRSPGVASQLHGSMFSIL